MIEKCIIFFTTKNSFTEIEYSKYSIFNYPALDTTDWKDCGFVQTYIFRAANDMSVPPQYIKPIG